MRRIVWAVLGVVGGSLFAQESARLPAAIDSYRTFVVQQMAVDHIPGLSVGFFFGDFQWAEGFGFADLESRVPATPQTSYRLASNTKSMTAVAVLQLAEKGLVDLDAEVQRYVPYFPRKPWPITLRQLLGHLGGVSHYKNYEVEGRIKEHKDTREAIAIFADFDLVAEPGTVYHYTSYGYNLLGAAIEGAAKKRYGDYLRENLWAPLRMDDTRMDDPDEVIPNRARGYRLVDGELRNSEFVDISSRFAAGGTRSTVLDMLKYARGLDSGKVLSQQSLDAMYTAMSTREGECTDYGMGWVIRPFSGHFCVYHTGGQPETRTLLLKLPRLGFALAIAYNFEGGDLFAYADRLLQLVLQERRVGIYADSPAEQAICMALSEVFDYGVAYFERYGRPLANDSSVLAQSFAYLNRWACVDSLRKDYKGARRRLRSGRHPMTGEAFVVVGSYMAHVLATQRGEQALAQYHKEGVLPFVATYCQVAARAGLPDGLSPELRQLVELWNRDWAKSWTSEVRQMVIAPFSNVGEVERRLRATLSGARVKPDFSSELSRLVEHHAARGNEVEATRIAQLNVDLYPGAARAWLSMCLAHVCAGQTAEARASLQHAREKDFDEETVTGPALGALAGRLAEVGKGAEAMILLELAIAQMPQEPALYAGMADLHLRRAHGYLQRAVEVDPSYERAWEELHRLR
ncbi:MAG: serine hydrolase [candidate division KSB1 bacterium]|nr:serine hydrolase [candidate division KSB1 bacterium]